MKLLAIILPQTMAINHDTYISLSIIWQSKDSIERLFINHQPSTAHYTRGSRDPSLGSDIGKGLLSVLLVFNLSVLVVKHNTCPICALVVQMPIVWWWLTWPITRTSLPGRWARYSAQILGSILHITAEWNWNPGTKVGCWLIPETRWANMMDSESRPPPQSKSNQIHSIFSATNPTETHKTNPSLYPEVGGGWISCG